MLVSPTGCHLVEYPNHIVQRAYVIMSLKRPLFLSQLKILCINSPSLCMFEWSCDEAYGWGCIPACKLIRVCSWPIR